MAQDPQTPPQIPGSDVLQDTLRHSKLTDAQRDQIWDAYHTPGDEKAFTKAINTLSMGDSEKDFLYDMRFKGLKNQGNTPSTSGGQPSLGTQAAANHEALPQAQGEVRPSVPHVLNALERQDQVNRWLKDTQSEGPARFWGKMIPDAAMPAISAINKYAVEPFDRMSQKGAQLVGGAVKQAVVGASASEQAQVGAIGTAEYYRQVQEQTKAHPSVAGAAQGLGELVGGTVSDPRMWPFALEGAAKGTLSRLAAKGFSTQMLLSAVTSYPEIKKAIQEGNDFDAARLITTATGAAGLGILGSKEAKHPAEQAVRSAVDKAVGPTPLSSKSSSEESLNTKTRELQNKPLSSTLMGPISATSGQQAHLDFSTKAPVEAQAPQALTVGATKSATVDKGSLVGQEAPVGLYRFPKEAIEGMPKGGTVGLGKVDLSKPATRTPEGGLKLSTDTLGVKWAENSEGVRVSVPSRIPAEQVQEFASQKIAEQAKMQEGIKARQEPTKYEPVASPPPAVDSVPKLFQTIGAHYDHLADLSRQADLAENDSHADNLNRQRQQIEQISNDRLKAGLQNLSPQDVVSFRDEAIKRAERIEAESKVIKDLTDRTIKTRGVNSELTDMTKSGGPIREIVINERGDRAIVKPDAEIKTALRIEIQNMKGEVPRYSYVLKGIPKGLSEEEGVKSFAIDQQRDAELVRQFTNIVTTAKDTGISIAQASEHVGVSVQELQEELEGIRAKWGSYFDKEPSKKQVLPYERKIRDPLTGESKTTFLGSGVGRRPKVPVELDTKGLPKLGAELEGWTTEKLRAVFGKGTDLKLTDDDRLYQHADMRQEKGRLLRSAADIADGEIVSRKKSTQGGFISGDPLKGKLQGEAKKVSLNGVDADDFLSRARKYFKGMGETLAPKVLEPGDVGGNTGFLVRDSNGKINWVGVPQTHSQIAEALYPHLKDGKDTALMSVLASKDIVRKARVGLYEVHTEGINTKSTVDMIHMDLIADRMTHSYRVEIDTKDRIGAVRALQINPGYEQLSTAIRDAKIKDGWIKPGQEGSSAVTRVSGMAAGGVAGAVAGTVVGGPVGGAAGAAAGMIVGFTAPDVISSPRVVASMKAFSSSIRNAGIPLKQWFNGPAEPDIASTRLQAIRREQDIHANPGAITWTDRLQQLSEKYAKGMDPFALIADKNNQSFLTKKILAMGKGTTVFNNLELPDTKSLYLAAKDAKGIALGGRADLKMEYNAIMHEAKTEGLFQRTTDWGRMLQIKRGFDVLQEHMQDLQQKLQDTQKALSDPNNTVRENIAFQDKLKELQGYHDDIQKRIAKGQAAPQGYTPQSLEQDMNDFQQKLNINERTRINSYWDRVFTAREKVLDLVHASGLVSDQAFQTYKARGKEYIPLERIVDDLAENKFHTGTQPLNLKQQSVIKTLEGSDRTPVDPWEALSKADAKAFHQVARNEVMYHALDLAKAYPQDIGKEFKEVKSDYRPKKGEQIVGHFQEGKPNLYAVPDYLGDALNAYPMAAKSALGAYASWWGHQFKRTATVANLGFQTASLFGHAVAGLALTEENSRDVKNYMLNWGRSVKSVLHQDGEFRELVRSGATFGGVQALLDPEHFASPSDLGWKEKLGKGKFLDSAQDLASNLENINRLTTFKNARLQGHNIQASALEYFRNPEIRDAAIKAKYYGGAPDFSRMGDLSQPFNQLFMFLIAHTSYAKQFGDMLRKDPRRIGGILVAATAATIALQTWNSQQKDIEGNALLRKVPVEERMRNWVLLSPWTYKDTRTGVERAYQFNIPKPYPMQVAVNPMEAAASNIIGKEDRTGTQQALDTLGHMSPIPLRLEQGNLVSSAATSLLSATHPVLKTAVQQFSNKDDFGYPIVPPSQQGIESQYQVGPHTSTVAQAAGKGGSTGAIAGGLLGAIVGGTLAGKEGAAIGGGIGITIGERGASPRRVDAGLRSMFAGSASQTESYLNPFFEGTTGTKVSSGPMDVLRSAPVVGPMISRFMGSTLDQQRLTESKQFYQTVQDATVPLNTFEYLKKANPKEALSYYQSHKNDLFQAHSMATLGKRMSEVNAAEKRVQDSPNLPEDKKVEMLANIARVREGIFAKAKEGARPSPQVGQATTQPGAGQGNAR